MNNPCPKNAITAPFTSLFAVMLLLLTVQQNAAAQSGSVLSKLKLKKNVSSQDAQRSFPSDNLLPRSTTTICLWDGRGDLGKEHFQCLPEVRVHIGSKSAEKHLEKWWVSWSTEQTGFAEAIYQVSMFPFPSGFDNWQSPPGLLKTGTIAKWSGTGQQPFFTIDLSSSLLGQETSAAKTLAPALKKQQFKQKQPLTLQKKTLPTLTKVNQKKPEFQQSSTTPQFKRTTETPRAYSLYVRIITLDRNNNLTATPSQAAVMHLSTPGNSQFVWYGDPNPNPERPDVHAPEISIVSYEPFQPYMSDWDRHFIVTKDMPMFGYSKGDTLYIPRDDGSRGAWDAIKGAIGNLVDLVRDCVNRVANTYEKLKNEALTHAISVAQHTVGCGDTCQNVFKISLDYGLIAMGIPPAIPNFDGMMSLGKEYLVAEIASEIQIASEISPGLSEEDVAEAIRYLESQVRKTAQNGADGSQWLRLNPKYQYRDAMLLLKVSNPTGKATDAISCLIHQQKEVFYFPFQPKDYYINIPPLKPGQTIRIPVLLRPNNVQCNEGKGMLMEQWNAMMDKGVLLQVFPGRNEQILVKQ